MTETILIVEDEPAIADNIVYALTTEGYQTKWCATGHEALSSLSDGAISLVVLDVGLPDINGFELAKKIRRNNQTPIIFLTARSDEIDRVVGLELGADDYIVKPFSPRELAARIRAVLRRTSHRPAENSSAESGSDFSIIEDRREISFREQLLNLSRYEFDLLKQLIENPGRVFTREQLMLRVWDDPEMSTERTVDTHIKMLRKKLRDVSSDELIITHRGVGYSLKEGA
jgi:two-component system catabolic regulation response regulator CreB